MGFKDLPGGSNSNQSQTAAKNNAAQQAPATNAAPQNKNALTNTQPSQ
ncbi:hypothetical protein SRRS_53510 [Sporomusa rhizae]